MAVTTPHSYKPEASGVTLVCRPTPRVRGVAHKRVKLKQLVYRMAQRTLGTLVLLQQGTIYLQTPKHY
jgi:hypothetical protein